MKPPVDLPLIPQTHSHIVIRPKKKKIGMFTVDQPSLFLVADPSTFSHCTGKRTKNVLMPGPWRMILFFNSKISMFSVCHRE